MAHRIRGGGNHSITAGILMGEGELMATDVIDLTQSSTGCAVTEKYTVKLALIGILERYMTHGVRPSSKLAD